MENNVDNMMNAVQWVLENKSIYNIKILNISIGCSKDLHYIQLYMKYL